MKTRPLPFLPVLCALAVLPFLAAACSRRVPEPRDIPVLMYHNVLPDAEDLSVWQVSAEEFACQMDQLANAGFEPILPDDIARAAAGRGKLPGKPVVITFDDGYEGVVRHAEPVLAAHGFKAICYVIAGRLAREGEERETFDSGPLLTAAEAAAMARRGTIAAGSHSMTHARNDPARLASEIGPSRKAIRRRLGVATRAYCYPFGLCGYDAMRDALCENGFTTALACGDGMFRFAPGCDLLAIPRVSVYGGHHAISLDGVDAARGEVRFANPGAGIPLKAVVRDPATGRRWESGVQPVGGRIRRPVAFAFPPEALEGEREIEAWDKFGLFRYFP